MPIQLQSVQESSTAIANDPIMEPPEWIWKTWLDQKALDFSISYYASDLKRLL